jgi:phosphatidylglycerophosphate synthase
MAMLLSLMSFSGAFIDVVVDALMVIEAKKFPVQGSQELLSWAWIVAGVSALVSGVFAACVLEYYSPYYCFVAYGIFGLFVAISAFFIPKRLEEDQQTLEAQMGIQVRSFSEELSHNCKIVKDCLQIKEMYNSILFYILIAFTVPRFDDYLYYYKTGPAGFSQFTYSILTLMGSVALLVGIAIY